MMKKLVMMMTVVGLLVTSLMSVSAAEVDGIFESNMDSETYVSTRTEQVNEALENGTITQEQAQLLLDHIAEVGLTGTFGNGPSNGEKGEGNAVCVLGDNELGVFRSESAGMRTGSGNGVGQRSLDGSSEGNGYKGAKGSRGAGRNLEECELDTDL